MQQLEINHVGNLCTLITDGLSWPSTGDRNLDILANLSRSRAYAVFVSVLPAAVRVFNDSTAPPKTLKYSYASPDLCPSRVYGQIKRCVPPLRAHTQ